MSSQLASLGVGGSFSPLSLPLLQWLKADAGTLKADGSAAGNGDPVKTWRDQSGHGADGVQATTAAMPTLLTNMQNGLPALSFDGTDDLLFGSIAGGVPQPSVTFIVARRIQQSTGLFNEYLLDGGAADTRLVQSYYGYASWDMYSGSSIVSSYGTQDTSIHLFRLVFNGASSALGLDGSVTSGDAGSGAATGGLTIGNRAGGGYGWPGYVFEVITCAGVLTAAQIAQTEAYLRGKWGTP